MANIENFWLFLISGLALNLTPGADMLYVIDRTIAKTTRNGIFAALGIAAGCFVHLLLAAVGVTALLAASPTALTILKYVGAAYLVWLGVSLMRSNIFGANQTYTNKTIESAGLVNDFIKGVAVNVLNPKIALFFIAFLPQFISQSAANPVITLITLGLIFNVVGTSTLFGVVWAASRVRSHLTTGSAAVVWYPRCVGLLMLALGFRLAINAI